MMGTGTRNKDLVCEAKVVLDEKAETMDKSSILEHNAWINKRKETRGQIENCFLQKKNKLQVCFQFEMGDTR